MTKGYDEICGPFDRNITNHSQYKISQGILPLDHKKHDKSQKSQTLACHDKAPQSETPLACHWTNFQNNYEMDCHDCFLMKHPPFLS